MKPNTEALEASLLLIRNKIIKYRDDIRTSTLAINEIDANHAGDLELVDFKAELQASVTKNRIEKKKEQIMALAVRLYIKEVDDAARTSRG